MVAVERVRVCVAEANVVHEIIGLHGGEKNFDSDEFELKIN